LATEARGHLTLLYFGYTNCPDVCPTTMADLGAALRKVPASVARDVRVVFITSDPARDTPAVMRAWLAHFDSGLPVPFVGLTSSISAIDAYGQKLGVALEPPKKDKDGTIEVTHGAQVTAFSPQDGKAHLVWTPGGLTPEQYASDIELLMKQVPA
ncbi:MAG TPA: SCO family protein, partial [Mycobacteriales bacterium]|nr:SCO family protein [Mycobacteriales bacterium]